MSRRTHGLYRTAAGYLMALALLPLAACKTQPSNTEQTEIYINPHNAAQLRLNPRDNSMVMTQGTEVLSHGRYYIKWKQLYCTREHGEIVIGEFHGDRIETDVGPFIKKGKS